MSEVGDQTFQSAPAGEERRLPRFGEVLSEVAGRFSMQGALGVVVIDASVMGDIERNYGWDAQERAMNDFGAAVGALIGEKLGIDDLIVRGETARNEIVVLLFREASEVAFYRSELPALHSALANALQRRGSGVGYPYLLQSPELPIGSAAALRNPTLGAESQVRSALEEARADGRLNLGVTARRRRARLFELVLEGLIHSVYEPIVEVESRTVFGYEALARGPEGSELHSPLALFAAATETDFLFQLDCLCRQSALDGARDLPADARLFVNVRPTTIHDPNFRAEPLCRKLEVVGLQPSQVVFEISEQESIGNYSIFREVRDDYGKLGFQFAIDDTGAGYASLTAVLELAPEFIKMDRAFVRGIDEDPARQELLRALRSVSERIGARIIGEGLDTLEELEMLGQLGVPFGQGWLFGKPTPLRASSDEDS